tara:strand:+ start:406 stop:810 length:405 start_codon:yes stop_codon:yes gene_type:complete
MNTKSLSPIELVTLSKLTNSKQLKEARESLVSGEYEGTMDIRVNYLTKIGEDTSVAESISYQQLFFMLANRVNVDTLQAVAKQYSRGDKSAPLARVAHHLIDPVKEQLSRKPRKGAVRVESAIQEVPVTLTDIS